MTPEEQAAAATAEREAASAKEASAKIEAARQAGANKAGEENQSSIVYRLGRTEERNELAAEMGLVLPDGQEHWTKKTLREAIAAKLAASNGKGAAKEIDPEKEKLREENAALLAKTKRADDERRQAVIDKRITAAIEKEKAVSKALIVYKSERSIELSEDGKIMKVRNLDGSPIFGKTGAVEKTLEEDFADWLNDEQNQFLKRAAENIKSGGGIYGSQTIPSQQGSSGLEAIYSKT